MSAYKVITSVLPSLLQDIGEVATRQIFVCSASVNVETLGIIDEALYNASFRCRVIPEKFITFGMFADNQDDIYFAQSMGWHASSVPNLHAKLVVLYLPNCYVVYLGSSNLSYSANSGRNIEVNCRIQCKHLPMPVKRIVNQCIRGKIPDKVKSARELFEETLL